MASKDGEDAVMRAEKLGRADMLIIERAIVDGRGAVYRIRAVLRPGLDPKVCAIAGKIGKLQARTDAILMEYDALFHSLKDIPILENVTQ